MEPELQLEMKTGLH